MMFLLSSLLALAQADRATILDGVESWYQVVQDGKNKGYVHEKLERVKDQWSYAGRADFEIDVKGGWHTEFREVEAVLDEDFAPVTLRADLETAAAKIGFTITSEGETRLLSILAGGQERREKFPADARALPALHFYALRQVGAPLRPGPQSARLLVPRAEGRIDEEISFEPGETVRREIAGKTGPLTPIRFLKPPSAARTETEWASALMDKYGRLVEITLRGGARIVLVEDDQAAFRGAVNIHRSARRDPGDKEGAMKSLKNPTTGFPDEAVPAKVTADTLASRIADLERRLAELRALEKDAERADAYFALLREWKAIRDKAALLGRPGDVARVDAIRDAAELVWDGAAQALAAARRSSVAVLEALDRVDLPALERELRSLRESRTRLELQQRPELQTVLQWIAQSEPLLARGRTRDELAKKRIVVTGTLLASAVEPVTLDVIAGVRPSVPFVRDLSTAAINGATWRVGDVVDGLGVRLEKVSSHGVTVSLRGELREVPIGTR